MWDKVYAQGNTVVINQCEQIAAIKKLKIYKPKNIEELTAFVAAIRPSFQSMLEVFLNRQHFEYEIPAFDKICQGRFQDSSFLLFQETIMQALAFSGIPSGDTYTLIKAISKKKEKVIMKYEEQFLTGFMENGECDRDTAEKVWQIIKDSARYGFNSAHANAVATDSLYNAWLKCDYPYEFYETCLALYSGEIDPDIAKDKDKISKLIKEMDLAFGIKLGKIKFGNDNRSFVADKENKQILPSLMGIKYMNHDVANILYDVSQKHNFNNFSELYLHLKELKGINKRHISTLINVGYFSDFGSVKKLERLVDLIENTFSKKTYNKEKCDIQILNIVKKFAKAGHEDNKKTYRDIDFKELYSFLENNIDNSEYSFIEILSREYQYTGNIISEIPNNVTIGQIVARSYKKPWILFSSLKTGNEGWIKLNDPMSSIPKKESIVMLNNFGKETKWGRTSYTASIEAVIYSSDK